VRAMKTTFVFAIVSMMISFTSAHAQAQTDAFMTSFDYADSFDGKNGTSIDAYENALKNLNRSFDQVCPDTFCEGDYSNLTSMDFSCAVETATGTLGDCAWTFSGSYSEVDATTGKLEVSKFIKSCSIDLKGLSFNTLVDEVNKAGRESINYQAPGKSSSIYDQLVDCI
jgi:hypothetical protein